MASRIRISRARCPICDKQLSAHNGLVNHMLSAHGIRTTSWGLSRGPNMGKLDKLCACGKAYTTWEGLYAHLNNKLPQCIIAMTLGYMDCKGARDDDY